MLARMVFTGAVVALIGTSAAAQEAKLYTLTNLHPDTRRALMYSTNYQQDGLIPMCTEVKQVERNKKDAYFEIAGTKYHYEWQGNSTPEGLEPNLGKYFGPSCDKEQAAIKGLSKEDQTGIKAGMAMVGMSKQGVIYAIGYPPSSRTPSTDADAWVYWRNRFATMLITFADGKVVGIR